MKESLKMVIFGDGNDDQLVALKCMLLKCGVNDFSRGLLDGGGRCESLDSERAGLFIVSASVGKDEMASIFSEARRLAIPVVLQV